MGGWTVSSHRDKLIFTITPVYTCTWAELPHTIWDFLCPVINENQTPTQPTTTHEDARQITCKVSHLYSVTKWQPQTLPPSMYCTRKGPQFTEAYIQHRVSVCAFLSYTWMYTYTWTCTPIHGLAVHTYTNCSTLVGVHELHGECTLIKIM